MTAPRRRWSFSLRTLFVLVTVLALAAWWTQRQVRWIQARDAFLDDLYAFDVGVWADRTLAGAPLALRLSGRRNLEVVDLPERSTSENIRLAAHLFPEAEIWIGGRRRLDRSTGEMAPPTHRP